MYLYVATLYSLRHLEYILEYLSTTLDLLVYVLLQ